MPLNHLLGEKLDGKPDHHRVVPVAKYKDLPQLTVIVRETIGKKFKVEVDVERPIWATALGHAQIAFFEKGGDATMTYDVLAQEYPATGEVVFIFCARIRGQEHFVVAPFQLSKQQIADLAAVGQWKQVITVN